MRTDTLGKLRDALLLAAVIVVPSVFIRITADPFDLIKGSLLWLIALPIAALTLVAALSERIHLTKAFVIPVLVFLAAASITSVVSLEPVVSIFGQTQRYTGLLTLASGLLIAFVISHRDDERILRWTVIAHLTAVIPVISYGIVQETGNDPFEWSSGSFTKFVFATLGNPNTATAWLGTTSPLLFSAFLVAGRQRPMLRLALSLALGLTGPMISSFNSFQGQIAVLFVGVALVMWVLSGERAAIDTLAATAITASIIIAAQFDPKPSLYWVSILMCLVAGASSFMTDNARFRFDLRQASRTIKVASGAAVVITVALAAVILRDRIRIGLEGGFLERGDFFRSARDIFFDHPILGTGLETFGFYYTEYRPVGHATNLEGYRTSSAHNIFLGMFANGGLVLGLSYMALIVATVVAGVRVMRRTHAGNMLFNGAFCSFLSFQVVSLVSVEHVALFTLNFVMMGLIFGWYRQSEPRAAETAPIKKRPRRKNARRGRPLATASLVAAALMVPVVALGWWQVSRPLRAAENSFDGLRLLSGGGDASEARELIESATRIYPYDVQNWAVLTEIAVQSGDITAGAEAARQVVKRSHYSGAVSPSMARVLFNAGAIDEAVDVSRESQRRDPFAPVLKQQFAEILFYAAQSKAGSDLAGATALLDELFAVVPDYEIEGLGELLITLQYQR